MRALVISLLFAASAAAQPTITSITPNSGAPAGGYDVTIKGTGFPYCIICSPPPPPPTVYFGTIQSPSAQANDTETLTVTVPPHLPGTVDVTVMAPSGNVTAPKAFTYTGKATDFDAVLFPIFSPPAHGAFGSLFVTDARAFATTESPVTVYGAFSTCGAGIVGPSPRLQDPLAITIAGGTEWHLSTECSDWPGRLLYVPHDQSRNVTFDLRVTDTTRTASSLGTEVPVVREARMTTGRIVLLNVPIDGRYRVALRIYALRPAVALVTTVGEPRPVQLQPGRNEYEPAYAYFTDFPIPVDRESAGSIPVTIEQPQDIIAGPPMWAFITVTNNETQQITTITPDF